jgi:DeoR/GlpR family transcriptional regulator of sugar metabolism
MSGGRLRAGSLIPRDPEGYEYIRKVNAELCVLGACRLHHEKGITVSDFDEAAVKETMIESAAKVALLATAESLNSEYPFRVAEIDRLTYLILVDSGVSDEALQPYEENGIRIIRT